MFWGVQVALPGWGLVLGGLIEAARRSRLRWELEADDFRRLWNVTALLFLGTAMYLFFANEGWGAVTTLATTPGQAGAPLRTASQGLLRLLQWLPILLFPFVIAHTLSRLDRVPWESASPLLRRLNKNRFNHSGRGASGGFHPGYPYLVTVLFTASADYNHPALYFPALTGLLAWALWPFRSRQFPWFTWGITVALVAVLGYWGQRGLLQLYRQLESWENRLFNQLGGAAFDPEGVRTDLEAVRRSKGSSRIVLRVRAATGAPPALLREAVYTHFASPYWSNSRRDRDFQPVPFPADEENWRLAERQAPAAATTVFRYTRQGRMPLALPLGTFEIRQLRVAILETNRWASARIEGGEKLVEYQILHASESGFDAPPDEDDLALDRLRDVDRQVVREVADGLGLAEGDAVVALARLKQHFLNNFEYSLETPAPRQSTEDAASPLREFMLHSRQGHCEFFATATTLLLRAAGIPTRYVVGWSIQESHGDTFVVRGRHAHAWAQAYVGNRWIEVDNTPGNWSELASAHAPWWEAIYDRISRIWLAFTRWRQGDSQWRFYVLSLGLGVLVFMAWRELRGGRWRRARRDRTGTPEERIGPGTDSEFYAVVEALERRTVPRPVGLPLRDWIKGLPLAQGELRSDLHHILVLHYRLRFDPDGLSFEERRQLQHSALRWLQCYTSRED